MSCPKCQEISNIVCHGECFAGDYGHTIVSVLCRECNFEWVPAEGSICIVCGNSDVWKDMNDAASMGCHSCNAQFRFGTSVTSHSIEDCIGTPAQWQAMEKDLSIKFVDMFGTGERFNRNDILDLDE